MLLPFLCSYGNAAWAQQCPSNIDFESGNFNGWTCYTGYVEAVGQENVITLYPGSPQYDRHTMYARSAYVETDRYGGFPVVCPNGSGHSIRLGNDYGGGQAEGVSYEFTIPPGQNTYSLVYRYAVVFQDPNHQIHQQPRMEIEIMNVTDNQLIDCSSFTFIPFGTVLPGFFESPNPGTPTPVWCKDWTPVSINLDGLAGKTIRLFFKTADCTFTRHFGYAYIDVDSECGDSFLGASYCPDDTLVKVAAPFGYESYTWYDSTLTTVLSTQPVLTLQPPPVSGTKVAVKVKPYEGYGCERVLFARLENTFNYQVDAGADTLSCNREPVEIGMPPRQGMSYQWQPSLGLNNPYISNPFATPSVSTTYVVTARHQGGGCLSRDTVVVQASSIGNTMQLQGKNMFCSVSSDSAVLRVGPATEINWYQNDKEMEGEHGSVLQVRASGDYFAELVNEDGCRNRTRTETIYIEDPRPGTRYPVAYAVENLPLPLQARDFGTYYEWTPPTYLSDPEIAAPEFTGSREQLYMIDITSKAGCLTVDTLLVRTVKNVDIQVPTAFTPNGDGLNDYLSPVLMGVKQLKYFRVYNRWGQLLYESAMEKPGWDGRLRGVPQPTGVVVWVAEGVGVDGRSYVKKGTSALIR